MERVIVIKNMIGVCYMQVCAVLDATDEEILKVANLENPAGIKKGWVEVARENYEQENIRPVKCNDDPDRMHFILIC